MANSPITPAIPTPHTWPLRWRRLVSVAIGLHLLAVVCGPLSLPPSLLGLALRDVFRPYLEAAWLDHAYKFFAPDPGPSHLVRYDVELADGNHVLGQFPDRTTQQPRLRYHRHFMLSEWIAAFPPSPDDERPLTWEELPLSPQQSAYVRSYALHLLALHSGRKVTLYLVEHDLPAPQAVEQGLRLDDPSLYRERKLGEFTPEDA